MRALVLVPLAFALGAIAMRLALQSAPAAIHASIASQPLPVATAWGAWGAILWAVLAATLLAAAAAYAAALAASRRLPLAAVIAACVAALCAAWLFPVWFSSDVYAYAVYGELARLGANPYAHQLLPHGNPIFEAAFPQWGNPPPVCVYGPLFVAIARAIVHAAAPLGVRAQLDAFRLLASVLLPVCAALAYVACGAGSPRAAFAAAAIALNPVAIWSSAEGHNDTIALAIVLAGFVALRRYGPGPGAFVAASSALVKIPGAIAALGIAVAASGAGRARALRAWLGATAGLAAAAFFLMPWGHALLHDVAPRGRYDPQASFQALFAFAPGAAIAIAAAVASALAAYGAIRLYRGDPDGWCALAAGAWVLIPNPYPWYGLWIVAIAVLAPRQRFSRTLVLLALATPLRYLPDAAGSLNPLWSAAIALGASAPLLAPFLARGGRLGAESAIISGS